MKAHKDRLIARSVTVALGMNWWLVLALVLVIVATMLLQVLPAFILQRIIDENFSAGVLAGVWTLAVQYLLVSAGIQAIDFLKVVLTTLLGQKILNQIRLRMAQRLSKLPMKYFTGTPVGDIMSRLTTDVDAVNTLFSAGIISAITDLFKIAGLMASLALLAPQFLWIVLAAIPLIFFLSNHYRRIIFSFEQKVRICVADIYTFIQEWLQGIRTVKAYAMEDTGKERFERLTRNHLSVLNATSRYNSWFPCLMQTLRAVMIALAIWYGAQNGTALSLGLTTGALAAACDLMGRLFAPIEALAMEFQTIQQALAGLERVRQFADEPLEERACVQQETDPNKGIEISGVSFSYDAKPVLSSITVTVPAGEKTVFVGRSGAGKTTLMNLVAGLYQPRQGTIRICEADPFTVPPQARRRLIGIVPQMPQVFSGTIRENITLGDHTISHEEVEIAVQCVGLAGLIARMPGGYETVIGEGAMGLSSGEIQLLSLARAIVSQPKVLLLDEPTSGMDANTEKKVFDAIRMAGQGRTILSISHRISGIVDADVVHLMEKGRIVESGAAQELSKGNNWYAMFHRMEQSKWSM